MCQHWYADAATVKAIIKGLNKLFVDGRISDQEYFRRKQQVLDTMVAVSHKAVAANLFVV